MTLEPLKGKLKTVLNSRLDVDTHLLVNDVKSAVEWLKNKFDNHRKNNNLWRLSEDESWSMAENWIDEAFEDVTENDTRKDS